MTVAQAGTTPPYDIDGSVPDTGIAGVFEDGFGSQQELGPINSNVTKLGVIDSAATPMLGTTNPNGQVDLRTIYLDTAKDSDDDTWLYLGWRRDSNNGSGVLMYEFMQSAAPAACEYSRPTAELIATCNPWANRQAGDFILVWDQQGTRINIILREWIDPDGDGVLELTAGTNLTDLGFAKAATSGDRFYGEGAVNLTDTIFAGPQTQCLTFGNVIPGTVTGNSDTADYKDTVLTDVTEFINISNCGAVRVTKDTNPEGGTGNFDYALERDGGDAIRYAEDGYTGSELTSATGTLTEDGDSELVVDLITGTDYKLDETFGADTPYTKTSIDCTTEDGTEYTDVDTTGAFPVIEGETTDCLITNTLQPGTLIVKKVVVNDNGGTKGATDFSFQVDGGTAETFEADGQNERTVDPGTYDVTEPAVSGYTTTYDNCTDVVVPAGGSATCTITNDDQPGKLIVKKVVINDEGGTKTAEDFSFQVNGGAAQSFEADGRNDLTVNAGTYSVTEPAVEGYTTTYDNCDDLVIPNGGEATCTITNDDTKASPTGTTTMSWTLHDELDITGIRGGAPGAAATVTFRVFSDDQCTDLVGSESSGVTAGGKASTSDGVDVTEPGTYYWQAEYSGDAFNNGFETDCGSEVTAITETYDQ